MMTAATQPMTMAVTLIAGKMQIQTAAIAPAQQMTAATQPLTLPAIQTA